MFCTTAVCPPVFCRQSQVGEYGLHNTPAGMKQIIDAAVKVCPALADLAIERTWAGLRPVTPDTFPVLGASPRCPNLFVAGGYWRNGVLLAPKTAQLVADAVCGCSAPEDDVFSRVFSMDRFSVAGTGAAPHTTSDSSDVHVRPPVSSRTGGGSLEASLATDLSMERAALEGANDGDMLSGVGGSFRTESGVADEVSRNVVRHDLFSFLVQAAFRFHSAICVLRTLSCVLLLAELWVTAVGGIGVIAL